MVYRETIKLIAKSQSFSDITDQVEEVISNSGVQSGICTIFSIGSTSAVIINENEPMLIQDIKDSLERVAPKDEIYNHSENASSHIKSAFVGNSQTIPIKEGKFLLGKWQSIMVANFDVGDREREVEITVIGE